MAGTSSLGIRLLVAIVAFAVALPSLPLGNMAHRHRGLTQPIADSYAEAASVCLDRHHTSPVEFEIQDDDSATRASAEWIAPDARVRGAWANEDDATEAGAYSCILAAVEMKKGMVAVRRAETGSGADYYVGPADGAMDDLEACMRLEISGVDKGDTSSVTRRLQVKIAQVSGGNGNLPALAGVIGFRAKLIALREVEVA